MVINNFIYFYHLGVYYYLPTTPDTISDTMESRFNATNALSRSAPVYTYVSSGPRTVQVSISLHRDMLRDFAVKSTGLGFNNGQFNIRSAYKLNSGNFYKGDKTTGIAAGHGESFVSSIASTPSALSEDYIESLINNLQAASLPNYESYSTTSKIVNPPMVAVRLSDSVFIKGVINSSVNVIYNKPILSDGKYSWVTVSFNVAETEPYTANEVAKKGSFRGVIAGGK